MGALSSCLCALNCLQPSRLSWAAFCRSVLHLFCYRSLLGVVVRGSPLTAIMPASLMHFWLWPGLGAGSGLTSRPLWTVAYMAAFWVAVMGRRQVIVRGA